MRYLLVSRFAVVCFGFRQTYAFVRPPGSYVAQKMRHISKVTDDPDRLMQDILKEMEQMNDFAGKAARDLDRELRARLQARQRKSWPEKFESKEMELIEKVYGIDAFDEMTRLMHEMCGTEVNEEDDLALKLMMLEALQLLDSEFDLSESSDEYRDQFKNSMLPSLKEMSERGPKVEGFPKNSEVLAWLSRWSRVLEGNDFGHPSPKVVEVLKSPFGPVSSSSCYEELGNHQLVCLKELLNAHCIIPHTKMVIKIVGNAVVSSSLTVSTVVEDTDGQYVPMQIYNIKGIRPTTDGLKELPIGASFFLKNPFLKRALDGWLILRVDQPFDLERINPPPLHGEILVVGDGDFSYSLALARRNQERGDANITASTLDSKETVRRVYASGSSNLNALDADKRVHLRFGVNALELERYFDGRKWDSIVWNFPYPANLTGSASAKECQPLLSGFFSNVVSSLQPNARVYVTLAKHQGGTTREASAPSTAWDVETLASRAGLELVEVLPFFFDDYKDYKPKRAYDDTSFPYQDARTHVLRLKKKTAPGEAPSERSPLSKFASMMLSRAWNPPSHIHTPWKLAVDKLRPHVESSKTACSLEKAAIWFGKAHEVFESLQLELQLDRRIEIAEGRKLVSYLAKVYSTPNGDLVASYSKPFLEVALLLCRVVALESCDISSFERSRLEAIAVDLNDVAFFEIISQFPRLRQTLVDVQLSDCILVSCALEAMIDVNAALRLASDGLNMVHPTPPLLYFRAAMSANVVNDKLETIDKTEGNSLQEILSSYGNSVPDEVEEEIRLGIQYCDQALGKSSDFFLHALYTKAFLQEQLYFLRPAIEASPLALYESYIGMAEKKDRSFPEAHYHAGIAIIFGAVLKNQKAAPSSRHIAKAREFYARGLAAEEERLSFFGPVSSQRKQLLGLLVMSKTQTGLKTQRHRVNQSNRIDFDPSSFHTELEQLLRLEKAANGLSLGNVKSLYKKTFGKPLPLAKNKSLRATIQDAVDAGLCDMEERGTGNFWITLKKTESAVETTDLQFHVEVTRLLESKQEKGIYLANFKEEYRRMFNKPVPQEKDTTLKATLQHAAKQGRFIVESRRGGVWVSLVRTTDDDQKAFFVEVRDLLTKNEGGMWLSSVKEMYQHQFGKEFPQKRGERLKTTLQRAVKAGVCFLEPRKGGLWLRLADDE